MSTQTQQYQYQYQTHPSTSSNTSNTSNTQSVYWQAPVMIDDSDLTFDGKPLNLLYEENQSRAVQFSSSPKRGRSIQK
ncbi:hypothetical protein BJ878DRAFT_544134 [Calycina marina]|uniref:Uncharacterized protein n=1 Tax=Calycina marina TaxID=1763456 RepID=A0A9P8CDG0_9HELO|nr:hypothetical protein BJ878DRAFT_544134 [Calycina marina]